MPAPARRTWAFDVTRVAKPPVLDGGIGWEEWPGKMLRLDREPSRWDASGAPIYAYVTYDDRCLYVAVNVPVFEPAKIRLGAAWGKDDGAEVCLPGKNGVFVLRGFPNGSMRSVTDAGAPAEDAERLGKAARFAAKNYGGSRGRENSGWRGEWAIPLEALGLKATPGMKMAFNIGVYRAEDSVWRCLEGTLTENWRLTQAATLQFK